MGKVKAKRCGLSESAATKGALPKKKINPFELHVNRQKYDVIGRKAKSDRGAPGISRSRAMIRRKSTLLQEYKVKDKSNRFFDRRIGERDREMTHEDRVIARFTAERMKMFNKKQIYKLADDEILTHRGQSLSEIEKFEDPCSDEDEDLEDTGKLDANFVEDAHFGGGTSKSEDKDKRSRKDLIEQLISESKKRKAEKQHTRQQTVQLTEKLDTEWQDLLPIMATSKKKPIDDIVEKPDSYDIVMRELKFESRVQASDPLKTEEEIQEEEKRKRAQLDAERKKRMQPDSTIEQSYRHRSADDLDDGFAIDDEPDVTLSYDFEGNIRIEGQMEKTNIKEGSALNRHSSSKESKKSDEEENDDSSSGGDDDDDDGGSEAETDDSLSDLKPPSEEEEIENGSALNKHSSSKESKKSDKEEENDDRSCDDDDDDDDDDDGNEAETDDSLSDLKPPSKGQERENEFQKEDMVEGVKEGEEKNVHNKRNCIQSERHMLVANTMSEKEKNMFLQEVRRKFPSVSDVPEDYEALQKMLKSHNAEKQRIIVTHIIDMNNISLNELNRARLEKLFGFLLQHIHHTSSQDEEEGLKILSYLAPSLFDLAHLSPKNACESVLEVLKEHQQKFQKHQHKYPTFDTLILFKVVSLLFPTSDFRHPVVTPSIVFICQMLFQCRIKSRKDISAGLFLVTIFLEFTVLSKRFSPAAINFLCGVLHLAIPKRWHELQNVFSVPPFRRIGPYSDLLVVENKIDDIEFPLQMKISDFSEEAIDTKFKIRALATALSMLNELLLNFTCLQASSGIFHHASILLSKLPVENYPHKVQSEIKKLSMAFQKLKEKTVQYLVIEKKRPKALRLYEPKIDAVFDGKRRRIMGQEKMEREKLLHKIKREHKAAVREIRRDNSFLAKLKHKEIIQSDMERMAKVKEIFGTASNQLGEIRALERKKKHVK